VSNLFHVKTKKKKVVIEELYKRDNTHVNTKKE